MVFSGTLLLWWKRELKILVSELQYWYTENKSVLEEGGGKYRSIYRIDAFLSINIDVSLDWIHLHYCSMYSVVSCIICYVKRVLCSISLKYTRPWSSKRYRYIAYFFFKRVQYFLYLARDKLVRNFLYDYKLSVPVADKKLLPKLRNIQK